MELREQALHFCAHIQNLTQIHCTLLDLEEATFCLPPYRHQCILKDLSKANKRVCDEVQTHLYGSYEAERWDGKYLYYCPRNLVFIASTLHLQGKPTRYSLITGPFIMLNHDEELMEEEALEQEGLQNIPRLTTTQARALNETVHAVCGYLTGAPVSPDVDSGRQAAVLQMIYDLNEQSTSIYPLECEQKLQKYIRAGNKKASQAILNELIGHLYYISGSSLVRMRAHVRELLTLMSRAAIEGGADPSEVFSFCYQCEKEVDTFETFQTITVWLSAILHRFISFMFDFTELKHQNVIQKTSAYIKNHLSEKISLEQAADHVYLSKSYFCRVLKDEMGCTFTEYVNRLRVERSKDLLKETDMVIADVASAVGYDDQSYFSRIFKRLVGVSPKQYRGMRT